jgi:hypothetical protein
MILQMKLPSCNLLGGGPSHYPPALENGGLMP